MCSLSGLLRATTLPAQSSLYHSNTDGHGNGGPTHDVRGVDSHFRTDGSRDGGAATLDTVVLISVRGRTGWTK